MTTTLTDSALACRVVSDPEEWRSLEPHWDRLLAESADSTPWQSFDFLTLWWRHLSAGMALRIFVVERDGVPCMVLPMQIAKWPWIPGFPIRCLEPIGMIMEVNRPRVALGRADRDAYHCAFAEIWKRRHEWHVLRIDEKPWDDPEVRILRDFATGNELVFRQIFSHLVPYLDLDTSWEQFLQGRSRRMRSNLRAARRKLEAMGPVELQDFQTPGEIESGFQLVLKLHKRSWKKKRKVEYSRSSSYDRFFGGWLARMAQQGRARILALCCNDRPVAATIALTDGTTYYSTQIVHDTEFNHCSPGTLLESMELETLMREGRYLRYDFLGSFLTNKMRWTDTALATSQVFVIQKHLRTFVMDGYYFLLKPYVRPAVIRFLNRFRKTRLPV